MTTETWNAARVADTLLSCERGRTPRTSIAAEWPGLDLHTAYIAQDIALADRRSNGEVVTGVKLGLTSRAKQQQMGVDEPSVAWLTDAMVLPAGLPVPADRLIHPRAEPEIAFVMGRRLAGPGVTAATALAAVDVILGAIEIIDSRYSGFKFTLADAVADNDSDGCVRDAVPDPDAVTDGSVRDAVAALVAAAIAVAVRASTCHRSLPAPAALTP